MLSKMLFLSPFWKDVIHAFCLLNQHLNCTCHRKKIEQQTLCRKSDNSDSTRIYWNIGIYFFIYDYISIDQGVIWVLTLTLRGFDTIKFDQLTGVSHLAHHLVALHKQRCFPLMIFSVNMSKFAGNGRFDHICRRNP